MDTLTWKGVKASINLIDKIYEKGISLTKKEMEQYQSKIKRSANLPKWNIRILSQAG